MQITLIRNDKIHSLRLPEKITGKYWIIDEDKPLSSNRLIGIEAGEDGKGWIAKSSKNITFFDKDENKISEIILEAGQLYLASLGDERTILYCEEFNEQYGIYEKCSVNDNTALTIGRNKDSMIAIDNPFVSSAHAVLFYSSRKWVIHPESKTNGTYLNSKRVFEDTELKPGDTIFIMGTKIVIGGDFFAINNPGDKVHVNTAYITKYQKKRANGLPQIVNDEEGFFYRSPRFSRNIEEFELKIDSPTSKDREDHTPIMLTLAPSMMMGVASFSTGIISMINAVNSDRGIVSAIPTMVMSVSMLAGMIIFPFIMRVRDKKQKALREKERQDKYFKYLNNIRTELKRVETAQEEILRENEPNVVAEEQSPDFWERRLWSRTPEQDDFLVLRVGVGNEPMTADLKFPDDRFAIDDDILRDEVMNFQREEHLLTEVPILVPLVSARTVGIVGDNQGTRNLVNNILLQLFLRHSYDEVKVICLYEQADENNIGFIRTARHLWDDESNHRFMAVREENIHELDIMLGDLIKKRREDDSDNPLPHYVVLSTSRELSNKCASFSEILEDKTLSGFSVICVYDDIKNLPKECTTVIEISGSIGIVTGNFAGISMKRNFRQDSVPSVMAEQIVAKMGRYQLDLLHGRYDLPGMLTFLDMFRVGKIEHLNIRQRWQKNNPVQSLRTPVGVSTTGETFYLDLHEKIHGPHGLVAGTTGSGKSEFIITFILSLAVNYHPDEVAFVLIDYKGGGLVGAFENANYRLPHLAGTITNLDGGAIMRSILSIRSELRRRQAEFNRAREIANEGTMDIYKYQKMYRNGQVSEPMPHLFIISDEFAELKSQQPEFMDQLISTARIGRSLGVHLILATQKPSGVVNEQIWANSKFKVCLKVQDRADSMDMLKRPDAAGIVETGRFYLQVGYNEVFELGQSAWSGAPYYESDSVEVQSDDSIEIIDELGNVTDKLKAKKEEIRKENGKQIVKLMEYLCKIAEEDKLSERQLWLPELGKVLLLGELIKEYGYSAEKEGGLTAIIGELDDPYRQKKSLLTVDFAKTGNVRIYGAGGSGKEMMVQTMIFSLLEAYTPEELAVYILDFGAESFGVFEKAPQVGAVIMERNADQLESFFRMIRAELRERKGILAEYGGDFSRYNAASENKLPHVIIVVNNYSNLVDSHEKYEDTITELSRDCAKYGIYFVITATSANAMRYRLTQNFVQAYSLKLNDRTDYPVIFGSNVGGIYPGDVKGRGIIREDETYVFQAANILDPNEDTAAYIKQRCELWKEKAGDKVARRIPVVPKFISGEDASSYIIWGKQLPLGISFENYRYLMYNLGKNTVLKVLAMDVADAFRYSVGIAEAFGNALTGRIIVLNGDSEMLNTTGIECENTSQDPEQKIVEIFNLCVERNNDYKQTNGNPSVDMSPILVIIKEYGKVKAGLSEDGKSKLSTLLDKMEPFWNTFVIVVDSYQGSSSYIAEDWFSEKNPGGVWVGNGVSEQIRYTITRRDPSLNMEIDSKTGYFIEKGIANRIRLVMPSGTEGEYEE